MELSRTIQQRIASLPPERQALVLDFVDYLLQRSEQHEERCWSSFSLTKALHGLVEEPGVAYGLDDLKERFR